MVVMAMTTIMMMGRLVSRPALAPSARTPSSRAPASQTPAT